MPNPPNKLAVRQFEQGDAAAVQRLYERAVGRAVWLPAVAKADANFARASQGEAVFVCHGPEGRLVGLLSVWVPESFIHHVYVDPEFERLTNTADEAQRLGLPTPRAILARVVRGAGRSRMDQVLERSEPPRWFPYPRCTFQRDLVFELGGSGGRL